MSNYVPDSVKIIGELNFEGNIIPHEWFNHIRFKNGKVDLNAIIILSEIVYWHRPTIVKDEITGQVKGYRKRFKADLLQKTYDSFAKQFGLTKRQATDAVKRLEERGIIKRVFRSFPVAGRMLSNVLFIELNAYKVKEITNPYHVTTWEVSQQNDTTPTLDSETYTESTTEITTENTFNRHPINEIDDVYAIDYYFFRYEREFKKEHPTVTSEQLETIRRYFEQDTDHLDFDNVEWENIIEWHFHNLPEGNDGNILYLVSNSGLVYRYNEEVKKHLYGEYE